MKNAPRIALKSVKTFAATMLETERELSGSTGPSRARRCSASTELSPDIRVSATRSFIAGILAAPEGRGVPTTDRLQPMALKLGLNLGYWGIGPKGAEAAEIVKAVERLGYDSVWAAESYGSDVVSVLAWLAPQTETIKLGAAIMQVPARAPAAAAMAGCTIDALSDGRFIFGFGPSGPQVSEGWYGVAYPKPWGRTREYVEIVRKIVAREGPVEYKGEHFQLPLEDGTGQGKALKLNFHPVRSHIPIFLGAIGPQVGRAGRGDRGRLDPDLLLGRRLPVDVGRAPRGRASRRAAARERTSRSRRRWRSRSTVTSTPRGGS